MQIEALACSKDLLCRRHRQDLCGNTSNQTLVCPHSNDPSPQITEENHVSDFWKKMNLVTLVGDVKVWLSALCCSLHVWRRYKDHAPKITSYICSFSLWSSASVAKLASIGDHNYIITAAFDPVHHYQFYSLILLPSPSRHLLNPHIHPWRLENTASLLLTSTALILQPVQSLVSNPQ